MGTPDPPKWAIQNDTDQKHEQTGDLVYPLMMHAVKSLKVLVICVGFPRAVAHILVRDCRPGRAAVTHGRVLA